MECWTDIAMILFCCTAANHLGLVAAAERVLGHRLYVIDCCKCFTFWSVLAYFISCNAEVIESLFLAFVCSVFAVWLELAMGFIDTLYLRAYEKVYPQSESGEASSPSDTIRTEDALSDVRKQTEY